MIKAKDKFKIGDKVKLSAHGKEQLISRNRETGTVVGFSPSVLLVRILRDETKEPITYHIGFWEPLS